VTRISLILRRAAIAVAALAVIPSAARAEAQGSIPTPAEAFGEAGRFSVALSLSFVSGSVEQLLGAAMVEGSYFIVPRLSAGVVLGGFYQSNLALGAGTTPFESATFRVGARIGYDLVIDDLFSVWFKAGPDLRLFHTSTTDSGAANAYTLTIAVFIPFVVHPIKGFFFGAGPTLSVDLLNRLTDDNGTNDVSKNLAFGLAATIGGSF
jgi:hypothetical protein